MHSFERPHSSEDPAEPRVSLSAVISVGYIPANRSTTGHMSGPALNALSRTKATNDAAFGVETVSAGAEAPARANVQSVHGRCGEFASASRPSAPCAPQRVFPLPPQRASRKLQPNPALNLTPCGSPRMAHISFWAMRGLPQGAG